ncbi:hypothetical protein DW901_13565 [Firmicutes bacterium AM41-5BH]|nr:hypothetical protein DW901_13565 [Firmicutes bacterium AM41-5BH]
MATLTFRDLRADEIDCRIKVVKSSGVSILLYKDARVDQNILDETVGPLNWQRSHEMIDGNLYCTVSIFNEERNTWVYKQDVGTESNTEKEKGQASDSFKRACFNWGIGRELYTAPFIWINAADCKISGQKCNDKFIVDQILIEDKTIVALTIKNKGTGKTVFSMDKALDACHIATLKECIPKHGQTIENVCKTFKVDALENLTFSQFDCLMQKMGEK